MTEMIHPVSADTAQAASWPRKNGLVMHAAMLWFRHMPKKKAWGARTLGRTVGRRMRATIGTVSGGTIAVDPGCLDIYTATAAGGGAWEPLIHEICKGITRPGDVFYDIGANAGIVSVDVAAHFNGKVRVVAFEPLPSLARHVALSARLSGLEECLTVFDVILGDAWGEATLYLAPTLSMTSTVSRGNHQSTLRRKVVPLDDLVESGTIPPPHAIKIDVEGSELAVLRGAAKVLRAHRPTILFEADVNMERFGHTRKDLVDLLSDAAPYRFFYAGMSGLEPVMDLDVPYDADHDNILAVSRDREMPPLQMRNTLSA